MRQLARDILGIAKRSLRIEDDLQTRFTDVYVNNLWRDPESRSGSGSRRGSECVVDASEALKMCVNELGIRSVNDIPCGDFNWIGAFLAQHPDVAYRGFDIVEPLIESNRTAHPAYRFDVLDATSSVPPRADVILCKDMLNHISYSDVRKALSNFKRSESTYLLASNNVGYENVELPYNLGGASRHLDITQAPLNYPQPFWSTHYLGLWRLSDFPD